MPDRAEDATTSARRGTGTPAAHGLDEMVTRLGLEAAIQRLRDSIDRWIAQSEPEIQEDLRWQFQAGSKYFRPITVFCCHRAVRAEPIADDLVRIAQLVEMFHNVSLIIDDIVDESTHRRGKPTLHARFGMLRALMVAGYIVADGYGMLAADTSRDPAEIRYDSKLFSELMKRLGVAECVQWRQRRRPLGVSDWRAIAEEDTGSMFEVSACLGGHSEALRRFGRLLGVLYHGCDDVGDVRGAQALGGGGEEDLRDGILTLPAALAIRDPQISRIFCKDDPSPDDLKMLALAFANQLPEAEQQLDAIAQEARSEASLCSNSPDALYALIDYTRELSRR
jgi:geranylgeranyl pyrophosphate synthase